MMGPRVQGHVGYSRSHFLARKCGHGIATMFHQNYYRMSPCVPTEKEHWNVSAAPPLVIRRQGLCDENPHTRMTTAVLSSRFESDRGTQMAGGYLRPQIFSTGHYLDWELYPARRKLNKFTRSQGTFYEVRCGFER